MNSWVFGAIRHARVGATAGMMILAGQTAWADTPPTVTAVVPPPAPVPTLTTAAAAKPPRLVVAIAVDQFSADLFAQYRSQFTGGLARLASGAVFPAGYQSHAATETCPGHSTLLTGVRPARSGIIANTWIDQSVARPNKAVYCAEDETQSAGGSDYVSSVGHLLVPTLGEWLKRQSPQSRNVAVAGKDRAALMMGGHDIDAVWFWKNKAFVTLPGRPDHPVAKAVNATVAATIASGAPALPLPGDCAARAVPVTAGSVTVGTGQFALAPQDYTGFRASPRLDAATVDLALGLVADMHLGQGPAPDLLSVSLSATDYVGHGTGTEGAEMCLQLHMLDLTLARFFAGLDARGLDYAVVLTADHGGYDMPERHHTAAFPAASREDEALLPARVAAAIAPGLGLDAKGLLQAEEAAGDVWVRADLRAADKARVVAAARSWLLAQPQVQAVFTRAEIVATPLPTGSPETWTLIERARASFHPARSGDYWVALKRGVVGVPVPKPGIVATHGSPWDYDRRVPILFWRAGLSGFEQPNPVETVDIAPTLAAWLGVKVPAGSFDGRCLDIAAGALCGGTR